MALSFNHGILVKLVQSFAPKTPSNGVCRGFTKMWVQSVLTSSDVETQFYNRLSFLSDYFSKEGHTIEKLKATIENIFSRRLPLTPNNLDLIEIEAFCEAIAIQQAPSTLKLDTKFISMNDHAILNPLTASKALKGREIEAIELGLVAPNRLELATYFFDLEQKIKKYQQAGKVLPPKMPFFLSSDRHTVGLYYDPNASQWHFLDINRYLDADKRHYESPPALTTTQLASSIFAGFWEADSRHTLFSTTYCAIDPDPELIQDLTFPTSDDPTRINNRGINKLLLAAKLGHTTTVKALIRAGFDINAIDHSGMTALMLAAEHGHLDIVKILLEKNAIQDTLNEKGATAFSLAQKNAHGEIVNLLKIPVPSSMPASLPSPKSPKRTIAFLIGTALFATASILSFALGGPLWVGIVLGIAACGLAASELYVRNKNNKIATQPSSSRIKPSMQEVNQLAEFTLLKPRSTPSQTPPQATQSHSNKSSKKKPRSKQ